MEMKEKTAMPLNEIEKKRAYAKYYTEQMAKPNPEQMAKLLKGPMDAGLAIYPQEAAKLLVPGYMEGETGYCIMENGAGYLAVNNKFPGVTLDMIKWWFAWHPLEQARYRIWNPYCHQSVAVSDQDREKILNPDIPVENKIADVVHFVMEDIGGGMEDVVIHFRPTEELGFSKEALAAQHAYIIGGYGLTENRARPTGKTPAIMMHYYRETEDGIESRTRFWLGYRIIKGQPVCVLPEGAKVPEFVPMGLALHNVEEFSHLASFLPQLYRELGESKPIQ
ncbi:DAPG hydrolase family protein [Emergencia timonensis]|uniref:DAPG hydrolase family protein n=1 Tax=Emergencia timonensis TaxID=1776384 RepID=UPI0039948370